MLRVCVIVCVLGLILAAGAAHSDIIPQPRPSPPPPPEPRPPLNSAQAASNDFWLGLHIPDFVVGAGAVLLGLEALFFAGLVITRRRNDDK